MAKQTKVATLVARVLSAITIGDLNILPNDLVEGDVDLIAGYEKSNLVDTNESAVEYCKTEIGKEVITLDPTPALK